MIAGRSAGGYRLEGVRHWVQAAVLAAVQAAERLLAAASCGSVNNPARRSTYLRPKSCSDKRSHFCYRTTTVSTTSAMVLGGDEE